MSWAAPTGSGSCLCPSFRPLHPLCTRAWSHTHQAWLCGHLLSREANSFSHKLILCPLSPNPFLNVWLAQVFLVLVLQNYLK